MIEEYVICVSTNDRNSSEVRAMFPNMFDQPMTLVISKAHLWPTRQSAEAMVKSVALGERPVVHNKDFADAIEKVSSALRKGITAWVNEVRKNSRAIHPIYLSVHRVDLESARKQDYVTMTYVVEQTQS